MARRKRKPRNLDGFNGPGDNIAREAQQLAARGRCAEAQTALQQAAKVGAAPILLDYATERVTTTCEAIHNPQAVDLGLDMEQIIAKSKQAAGKAAAAAKRGAAWAAPRAQAAAKRGYEYAAPKLKAKWDKVPRNVKIGMAVAAAAGAAWWLVENRDRNPPGTKSEFAAKLWRALQGFDLSASAKRILIAQFALESGWGIARAAVKGFNYGNITAAGGWKGPHTWAKDKHCMIGGAVCLPIVQRFRKYYSDEEAIRDYFAFMSARRYAGSMAALRSGNLENFASTLRAEGYYTASVEHYVNGMRGTLAVIDNAKADTAVA